MLAALGSLAVACSTIAGPTPRPTAPPPLPTTTPVPGGGGDVGAMPAAWSMVRSYRLRVVGTRNGTPMEIAQEVVKPDFDHVDFRLGGDRREVVRIGRSTYMWANGQWRKFPDPAPNPFLVDPTEIVDDFSRASAISGRLTKGGVTTVDGAQCQEWTMPGTQDSAGGTLCIGLGDNLPRRLIVGDNSATFTFWDWNADIPIEAPPVP